MLCEAKIQSRGEQKHFVILEAASGVFLEVGYDVASMDKIASVAGVSKRTIYSHFGSKKELFISVMFDMCTAKSDILGMVLDTQQPVKKVLTGLGRAFLRMVFDPEGMTLLRNLVSQAVKFPELGQAFFDGGPKLLIGKVTEYFEEQEKQGRLNVGDCEQAAGSFLASLFGVHQMRCLATGATPPGEQQIDAMVDGAVQRFLYGVLRS